jgi:hypothetical protein
VSQPASAALLALLMLAASASSAQAADYSFDAAEIEKKSFEAGGSAEFKQEALRLRPHSPLFPISFGSAAIAPDAGPQHRHAGARRALEPRCADR